MTQPRVTRYSNRTKYTLGKLASLLVLLHNDELGREIEDELALRGYRYTVGKVGSMDLVKVVAAIETSAKANHVIDPNVYREVHSLYHAILEAIQGVGRGTVQFGEILRTVGLTFSIVRGVVDVSGDSSQWISVCIYGTIGAPKKGFEHDALGFGYNHI
ncbi:hut operon transcriptional regulator HutP [Paenibacillus mendelii]|uniref:Hut operon positive regulatory protein n=1 Tax=Paenibacillus mendelii TaxID=206163 RepID=A0ABV6JKW1_9BACL|nr:hut operon transcriptional regulator HutP [Paenibacillus mendelii]MCQ6563027.1 hut operon transcriptional regulator HutP [Paenibacillus mendelii]